MKRKTKRSRPKKKSRKKLTPAQDPLFNQEMLEDILSQPTAPFREGMVKTAVTRWLAQAGVPTFEDRSGNIVVGAKSRADYRAKLNRRTSDPLKVFIAHMDHPGLHGVKWGSSQELEFNWHGGSPVQGLDGSSVWLANESGWVIDEGKLADVKVAEHGRGIESGKIVFSNPVIQKEYPNAKAIYGGFGFRSPHIDGRILRTKAADDLAGVFAIVSVAIELYRKKSPARGSFIGLLTRAEEVGFIGTLAHLEEGDLVKGSRAKFVVSLEASKALPGAEIGKGPVVRLGDRRTLFHSGALHVLGGVAEKTLPGRYQKRIMDGGSCEGTAATAWGLPVLAMSIPLGNYHNQNDQGQPDSEFVHLDDLRDFVKLCAAIMKPGIDWTNPFKDLKKQLQSTLKKYKKML